MVAAARDEDDVLLPSPEERATMLADFEGLVHARGWTWLVTSPLLEATPDYFPDRWSGGAPSLRRLFRRLARYAGLEDIPVHVEIHPVDPGTGSPVITAPSTRDGAVWFDAAGPGLSFHAEGSVMRTPQQVVPAAARAMAHAWLDHHGLLPKEDQARGRLIDLATVYLGFGVITTAAAHQHIATAAGGFRADRKQLRLGILGPRNMAFALSIYALARRLGPKGRKQIARRMAPNPAAFFKAGAAWLEGQRPALTERLGIPERDEWPPARDVDVLTGPLPAAADDPGNAGGPESPEDDAAVAAEQEEARQHEDRGVKDMNVGRPVFRVQARWGAKLGRFLAMAVFIGGGFVVRSMPGSGVTMTHLGIGAVGLGALGYLVGLLFRDERCSEPKCGAALDATMTACPRCGGTIAGTIKNAKERLAAEEALAQDNELAPAEAADGQVEETSTPRQNAT